jgi:hypothetical protein
MNSEEVIIFSKNVSEESPRLSAAEKMYQRHLTNVKRYQHKNSERMKLKAKTYIYT